MKYGSCEHGCKDNVCLECIENINCEEGYICEDNHCIQQKKNTIGANSGINLDLDGNGNLDASDIGWLKNNINDFWETILNKDPKKLHLFIKDLVAHFNN